MPRHKKMVESSSSFDFAFVELNGDKKSKVELLGYFATELSGLGRIEV